MVGGKIEKKGGQTASADFFFFSDWNIILYSCGCLSNIQSNGKIRNECHATVVAYFTSEVPSPA